MEKIYQIRYNTNSTHENNTWRLISDDEEILVSDIFITSKTHTTKDFIKEINSYKYHITCTGNLTLKDNVAYITTNDDKTSLKRHIAKTITYRVLATCITVLTALILGANLKVSALMGLGEVVVKPVFYFIHERAWYKTRFLKRKKY